jgi:hypothetical protein
VTVRPRQFNRTRGCYRRRHTDSLTDANHRDGFAPPRGIAPAHELSRHSDRVVRSYDPGWAGRAGDDPFNPIAESVSQTAATTSCRRCEIVCLVQKTGRGVPLLHMRGLPPPTLSRDSYSYRTRSSQSVPPRRHLRPSRRILTDFFSSAPLACFLCRSPSFALASTHTYALLSQRSMNCR